jgi:S1-C subfamily serine protease
MAFVGEALGSYLGLSSTVTTGIVATLSYLGPRGARDIIDRVIGAAGNKV